jgi:protein-S-isoprenylcysteine O-methyltransferase Ste14
MRAHSNTTEENAMSTATATPENLTRSAEPLTGPAAQKAGWTATTVTTLFLGFDAVTHLLRVGPVVDANAAMGAPDTLPIVCGVVLGACLIAYLVPVSRAMGTILITAYLGGACAAQLITDGPLFSVVFPILVAVIAWAGAWPRDARLRALIRR